MTRAYAKLRETTFDLLVERDQLPSYYRFIALIASWLALVGYLLFSVTMNISDADLYGSRTSVTAAAGACLVIGYTVLIFMALFGHSLLFLVDCVGFPALTASFMGLVSTVLVHGLHNDRPVSPVYTLVPLITSCVATVTSLVVLGFMYRQIHQIKRRDERRRWHANMGPYQGVGDGHVLTESRGGENGLEDEAQRRQLMRLLQRNREHAGRDDMYGTYRIDLPGQPRGINYATPTGANATRDLPSRFKFTDFFTTIRQPPAMSFKDARERRRDEIERAGMPPTSSPRTPGRWRSQSRSRSTSRRASHKKHSNSWGDPPATRYA